MAKRKNRRMFTNEELKYAAKILNFHAPLPKCICGSRNFKFGIAKDGRLYAHCLKCGEQYTYEVRQRRWLRGFIVKPLANIKEAVLPNF